MEIEMYLGRAQRVFPRIEASENKLLWFSGLWLVVLMPEEKIMKLSKSGPGIPRNLSLIDLQSPKASGAGLKNI